MSKLKYVFNVEEKYKHTGGLIPKAIYEAQTRKVDESVREQWEEAIKRQVEIDELGLPSRFSWHSFLSGLIP